MKAFLGAGWLVLSLTVPLHAIDFRTVVLTGDPAPGAAPGVTFSNVFGPVVNNVGEVAFNAFVAGPGIIQTQPLANNSGTWSEGGGMLHKSHRQGDPAPGVIPATTFGLSSVARINNLGQTTFSPELREPLRPTLRRAIYVEDSGSLELIAEEGTQAPGLPTGFVFLSNTVPIINDLGQIAFESDLDDPNDVQRVRSVWTTRSGSLNLVARSGEPVPGTSTTLKNLYDIRLNEAGQIAFGGHIDTGPIVRDIWTDVGGTLTEVARDGKPAVGFPDDVNYGALQGFELNNAGHISFGSTLTGVGIDSTNNAAIWEGPVNNFRIVVQKGNLAPGTSADAFFGGFLGRNLSGSGRMSFVANLMGAGIINANDTGLWREGENGLELVAREGDAAPGTPPGTVFGDLSGLGVNFDPFMNAVGQVAFVADLTGPGITGANDRGLWATDLTGRLRLIAREGDLFDLDDDPSVEDLRTIQLVRVTSAGTSGDDGTGSALNNAGQLTFALTFTDSTSSDPYAGIFVAETAIVPEPTMGLLMAMMLVGFGVRRK